MSLLDVSEWHDTWWNLKLTGYLYLLCQEPYTSLLVQYVWTNSLFWSGTGTFYVTRCVYVWTCFSLLNVFSCHVVCTLLLDCWCVSRITHRLLPGFHRNLVGEWGMDEALSWTWWDVSTFLLTSRWMMCESWDNSGIWRRGMALFSVIYGDCRALDKVL